MNLSPLDSTGSELGGTAFANMEIVVPESLKFQPQKRGMAARRIPVKIRAENSQYASNNNKLVRFIFPNNGIYDTRKGYLTFDLTITATGATFKRIHSGIFSIFQRLRVLVGSTEIEDLRDFNRLYALLWEIIQPIDVTGNLGVTSMGFGTQLQRNALGATPSQGYACPLFSGVLNTELLPFDNFNSSMQLELYIDDAINFVETDGTSPQIAISNVVLHMERLELDQSYRAELRNYVATRGLTIGFRTWDRIINTLTTGAQQNIIIQAKNSSINGILNVFVDSSTIANTTVNDRFITWRPSPSPLGDGTAGNGTLVQTQMQINATMFPDEPVDTLSVNRFEAFQMLNLWLMKFKLNGFIPIAAPINALAFATTRFVQIDDLEPYPEEGDLVNPFTTLQNSTSLTKKHVFNNTIAPNYQLDSYVEYYKLIKIGMMGNVIVLQ
jgi:hypothetical protein